MKRVAMYSSNGTEVLCDPEKVQRMKDLGWSEERPAKKKQPGGKAAKVVDEAPSEEGK